MGSDIFVRVTDKAGNQFLCPLGKLRNPKDVDQDILDNCVDEAVVQRYAGNIKIKE